MKAVILAAGYGSRMYPLAQDIPKCLLTIKGETWLGRQLRILKNCGIKDITVITGFHQEKIVELYGEEVSIRYNPHYEITSTIFSLWIARDLLNDDALILSADIIFTEKPIRTLLANDNSYCLIVDKKSFDAEAESDAEAEKVKTIDNIIIEVSKSVVAEEAYGEFMAIAKIKKEGLEVFRESMFECVKKDSNAYWSAIFQNMLEKGHQINFILIDSPWIEIDTKEDYKEARKLFENETL